MCISIMASGFTINSFDYTASSRTEYSFRMDAYNSLPREISFGDRCWYNGPQSLFHQPYGNEHNAFQDSHLVYHQPFVNERIQDPRHMYPETGPNENEPSEDRSQNSYSCFYRKKSIKSEGLLEQLNLSLKLPADYYRGTYPLNVQLPDVFQSINIDILSENQKFSEYMNETIEDTYLINKSNDNETKAIKVLHQPILQPSESKRNDNRHLNSNNNQTCEKELVMPESFYPHYSGSDINQNTHLQHETSSGSNFDSITNMNFTSATMESNSNECLNSSSSQSSKYESNGTGHSLSETGSNPDITIVKDFPSSKNHQPTTIFVKTERLHSPIKMIHEKLHMGHNLNPSSYQASNAAVNEIQKSDTIISHLLQNMDQNFDPSSFQAGDTEANEIQKSDSIIRHLPKSNSNKHRPKNSRNHLLHQEEFKKTDSIALAKNRSKKDSHTTKVASKKCRFLNSCAISGDKFVNIEELEMLLQDLSKFDVNGHQGLNPDCTMYVNIYIVGLGNCDTTRLFETFAKKKIDGMVFVKKLKTAGITLKIKIRLLQNPESSFSLKTCPESSRNVIVVVYDVTGTFDVYAIRPIIECLKLAKLPILLIGNTSEITANRPKIRLVAYRDGYMMKEIYKLSLFFECSFESSVDVDNLFNTAVDSAFRFRL